MILDARRLSEIADHRNGQCFMLDPVDFERLPDRTI